MKILVGISGGFDSAYSVQLLKAEGHTVEGAVLEMHDYTELAEAKAAAEQLRIPLHVLSCRELFEREVVENFCDEYLAARTPNPCIICNERVKFRVLFDYAMQNGFDRIATGHYAGISKIGQRYAVTVARDKSKDQSYMLYRLPCEILEKLLLPMGNIIKKEAKTVASRQGLFGVEREESQEICFIGTEKYADFIERRRAPSPHGFFTDEENNVLGEHRGIIHYTVGQRKGLGVSAPTRLFIKEILPEENRIVLSDQTPMTRCFKLSCPVFSGMTREEVLEKEELWVRVRYTAPLIRARVFEKKGDLYAELLEENRCAVTPGQSAVFYHEDAVCFGGMIHYAE